MNGNINICDTVQLFIFIRGIDINFNVNKELTYLCSLKINYRMRKFVRKCIDKSLNNLLLE